MRAALFTFIFSCLLILFSSAQPAESEILHSVILIGDAGEHKPYSLPILEVAKERLDKFGEDGTVVYLGDNIYPLGLPPEDHPDRAKMEAKLSPQLDVIKNTKGRGIVVPGNHDWAKGRDNGRVNLMEQQEFTDKHTGNDESFYPRDVCPGPVEITLTETVLLVIVDSQWLLSEELNVEKSSHCEFKTNKDVFQKIEAIVSSNMDKNLLFAMHHPVMTYGSHGGIFQLKQHIFPLTDMKKGLYIPLPVIGSIYPLYRKWFGNIQDTTNPTNKFIMAEMVKSFEKHPRTIHAAGHEHALEHMVRNNVEYIVSGAGSKTEFVKKKGYAQYVTGDSGFSQLYYYENGEVWMEFQVFNEENPRGIVAYKTQLFQSNESSND